MLTLKGLSQEPLLSQRRARGKEIPCHPNEKTETEAKWKMVLLTLWEGPKMPHHISLPAYEAARQQATKDADL